MIDHRVCEGALRQTRLGRNFQLHEGMICAGGEEGKDACEVQWLFLDPELVFMITLVHKINL